MYFVLNRKICVSADIARKKKVRKNVYREGELSNSMFRLQLYMRD